MNEYKSEISLRITHPSMSPDTICSLLAMHADVRRCVGATRTNPVGKKLPGVWKESYCGFDVGCHSHESFPKCIGKILEQLASKKLVLDEITSTGGNLQIYVLATPTESTFGEEISWSVMRELASLKINLALEIY